MAKIEITVMGDAGQLGQQVVLCKEETAVKVAKALKDGQLPAALADAIGEAKERLGREFEAKPGTVVYFDPAKESIEHAPRK